eukprot:Clim_evm40s239 gene=Clim_evmTU40s239
MIGAVSTPTNSPVEDLDPHARTWKHCTFRGWVRDQQTAQAVFDFVRKHNVRLVRKRPRHDGRLFNPGDGFIFDTQTSGTRRWTDGFKWSDSLHPGGGLMLYKEQTVLVDVNTNRSTRVEKVNGMQKYAISEPNGSLRLVNYVDPYYVANMVSRNIVFVCTDVMNQTQYFSLDPITGAVEEVSAEEATRLTSSKEEPTVPKYPVFGDSFVGNCEQVPMLMPTSQIPLGLHTDALSGKATASPYSYCEIFSEPSTMSPSPDTYNRADIYNRSVVGRSSSQQPAHAVHTRYMQTPMVAPQQLQLQQQPQLQQQQHHQQQQQQQQQQHFYAQQQQPQQYGAYSQMPISMQQPVGQYNMAYMSGQHDYMNSQEQSQLDQFGHPAVSSHMHSR